MHVIWNEMGMFNVTDQRLVDQKNNILKRKCLSDLELKEIQRNIEDIGHGEVGIGSNEDEGWFLGSDHEGQYEVVLEDVEVPILRRKEAMFL